MIDFTILNYRYGVDFIAKTRPPAYYKYAEKNPTVSFVLTADLKKALNKFRGELSYGLAIKKLISKKIPLYEEGYELGFSEAKEEFEITYPCSVCGEPLSMSPDGEDYKDALQQLKKTGWCHSECANGE